MADSKEDQLLDSLLDLSELDAASKKEIAKFATEKAVIITDSKVAFFGVIDENKNDSSFRIIACSDSSLEECDIKNLPTNIRIEDGDIWAEAIRNRAPVILNDYQIPNPLKKGIPPGHLKISRILLFPLFDKERAIAFIAVGNKSAEYNQADIKRLNAFMTQVWRMILWQENRQDLLKEKEQFKIFADYTVDWETWLDPEGGYYYISPSCEKISGYSPEEFIKNPNLFFEIILDEDKHIWTEKNNLLLQHDQHEAPLELRIKTKSGTIRWIEHRCQPVFSSEKAPIGRRGSNRDITSRKEREAELKKLKGILPICASCKKIRDKQGTWQTLELYIRDHSEAEFTHGMCPECAKEYFNE